MKNLNFIKLGDFEEYVKSKSFSQLDISTFLEGVHNDRHIFFKLDKNRKVEWVINRVCDHAGGQLIISKDDNSKATCPLHNWEFDFNSLSYSKIPNQIFHKICKTPLPFSQDDNILKYEIDNIGIRLPEKYISDKKTKAKLRHIAHASVSLTLDDIKIVTDPWLVGPCFSTGWWHKYPPKEDAFKLCEEADFIYLSHNHPDHMHAESLSKLSKDKHFIIPAFKNECVLKPLKNWGFKNIHALELGKLYQLEGTNLIVSIMPCGDQRDDSALYINKGDFSSLFTVDCNAVNHYILPQNLTLLMTNFASGASGWPIVYETMPLEDRNKIMARNRNSQIFEIMKYIEMTMPKIYIPYAGYLAELAQRDEFIRTHNGKNTQEQVIERVNAKFPQITTINPIETDETIIDSENIEKKSVNLPKLYEVNDKYISTYLDNFKKQSQNFDIQKLVNYFKNSGFEDDLVMYLIITGDDFTPTGDSLKVEFSGKKISTNVMPGTELEKEFRALPGDPENKTFMLKARKDSLWNIVSKNLPFEELSIGFQCRIYRKPDIYNAKFWKYFTSEFIFGEGFNSSGDIDICY